MSLSPDLLHQKRACTHCGTTFRTIDPNEEFCCSGCAFVYDMITDQGLDQFYDLKGKSTTRPVQNIAFERSDYEWLEAKAAAAERETSDSASLEVGLDGASCAGCVWLIERLFAKAPGGLQVITDPVQGRMELSWEKGQFDITAFAHHLQQFGYKLCLLDASRAASSGRDPMVSRIGLCAAFAMNSMAFTLPRYLGMPEDFMFAGLFQLITALSATLALAVGGSYFIRRAWQALHQGVLHVDVPIALGLTLAYIGSVAGWLLSMESMLYFDFVAIFVFLMLGGRWVQEQAMKRNQRKLFRDDAIPKQVETEDGPISLSELQKGQAYSIKPNQIVPIASRILSDSASLGMEWIQGESDTREEVSGAVAGSGAVYRGQLPLQLEARERWADSMLFRLTKKQGASKDHPLLQQILRVYLWVVLVIGLSGGVTKAIATGDIASGLQVTLSIFVISCPCALGVAIPLADEFAASHARRMGVFVQQLSFWSRLRRVRHLLFDKTGTLTLDTPKLMNADVLRTLDEKTCTALATLASSSSHPISRSLTECLASQRGIQVVDQGNVEDIPGKGLRFIDSHGCEWALSKPPAGSRADVEFKMNNHVLAKFDFQEALRDGAITELAALESQGIHSHILSGDREEKVSRLANLLGISQERFASRMTPDEKAAKVAEIDHSNTLYVGDGANDSLAFDRAYVTATPAFDRNLLTDKADCYFVTRSLNFLNPLIQLARRRHQVIHSVFAFAVAYNIVAIAICLAGNMNPLLAAVLMPISSIITTAMVALGFRGLASQ